MGVRTMAMDLGSCSYSLEDSYSWDVSTEDVWRWCFTEEILSKSRKTWHGSSYDLLVEPIGWQWSFVSLLSLANKILYPFLLIALCELRSNTINLGVLAL